MERASITDRPRSMQMILGTQDRGHAGAQSSADDDPEGPDPEVDQRRRRRLRHGFQHRIDEDPWIRGWSIHGEDCNSYRRTLDKPSYTLYVSH